MKPQETEGTPRDWLQDEFYKIERVARDTSSSSRLHETERIAKYCKGTEQVSRGIKSSRNPNVLQEACKGLPTDRTRPSFK
jgi:hypothetical protein